MRKLSSFHSPLAVLVVVGLVMIGLAGCQGMNKTQRGAAIGAGAGAVVGGVIGKASGGSTVQGAIIGAAVGGSAGAIIGRQMDRQAQELEEELEDARVARVGEGIEIIFDSGILFDFDSAALRSEARNNLNSLAESLRKYPETEVIIIGHTDSVGRASYNQGLSERRAQSAASQLMGSGISGRRITTMGKGETDPIASNETDEGRQMNRRVEVAIIASEEYRERLKQQEG